VHLMILWCKCVCVHACVNSLYMCNSSYKILDLHSGSSLGHCDMKRKQLSLSAYDAGSHVSVVNLSLICGQLYVCYYVVDQ